MATLTAFILIGNSHPNHGGIIPKYSITLAENDRPCLRLASMDSNKEVIKIIPTNKNLADDIYFLVYSFILKKNYENRDFNSKEMHELFTDEERNKIYDEVKTGLCGFNMKIVFNILVGSTLLGQLDKIKEYPIDYEVTTPLFRKELDHWTGKVEREEYR